MQQDDRRRHERLNKEVRITCQEITYPLGGAPEIDVKMLDVSEGGVRLESPLAFAPGLPLQVALALQGWHRHTTGFFRYDETSLSRPLTAVGRVVRCEPLGEGAHDVGVEFVDIWADHWRAMRIHLEKERARAEGPEG